MCDRERLLQELDDVNEKLSSVLGYNRTLRLEAEKTDILRRLGRVGEAEIIEAYIREYK